MGTLLILLQSKISMDTVFFNTQNNRGTFCDNIIKGHLRNTRRVLQWAKNFGLA